MSFKISDGVAQVKLNDARTGNALIRGLKRSLRASKRFRRWKVMDSCGA